MDTLARSEEQIPLTAGNARSRRSGVESMNFAARRPAAEITARSQLLAAELRAGRWDEPVEVLWRYREYLQMTAERLWVPPALDRLLGTCLEQTTYDGVEYMEGFARRFFCLIGAVSWQDEDVVISDSKVLHLVNPDDRTKSLCGSLKRGRFRSFAARGHFHQLSYGDTDYSRCKSCRLRGTEAFSHPAEDGFWRVLGSSETFGVKTESTEMVGAVKNAINAVLYQDEQPAGDGVFEAGRDALTAAIVAGAVERLAGLDWESLRARWLSARSSRLGSFYRLAYGRDGERAIPPSREDFAVILSELCPAEVLVEGKGNIFDPEDFADSRRQLEEWSLVPALLARCFPEMLALIQGELENPGSSGIFDNCGDDYRELNCQRLDGIWRRADLICRGD